MTREELKAHLKANEEHVRRMTEEVTQKLEGHLDEVREDRASFKEGVREELQKMRRDVTWTLWMSLTALDVFLVFVTLATRLVG
jgi:protein required for attachment to host cells